MLTASGVKLLDFGLARLRSERDPMGDAVTGIPALTAQNVIIGTLHYIAPEQLECREVDSRATCSRSARSSPSCSPAAKRSMRVVPPA
jgi:serine/threonine protein kinase